MLQIPLLRMLALSQTMILFCPNSKHRKQLLTDDAQEGWVSELHHYLSTMQGDATKDTDLVEWWQVWRSKCGPCHPLTNLRRIMHNCILHLRASPLMYFPLRLHQFLVNEYSLAVSKLRLTAEHVWIPLYLKNLTKLPFFLEIFIKSSKKKLTADSSHSKTGVRVAEIAAYCSV